MGPGMFDGLGKALAFVAITIGVGGTAIGYGGGRLASAFFSAAEIDSTIARQTMDMAKYGKVDKDMICAETIAFQKKLAKTLAAQQTGNAKNPVFVMTGQACIAAFE